MNKSNKNQTGYKETKIGLIPEDWDVKELIDFCIDSKRAIVDGPFGSNLKSEHLRSAGVPVINSSFVTEFIFNPDEYTYVDNELFQREIRSKVVSGDIVMAKIGARCGSSAIMPDNHPISILSGNSLKITIDENENSTLYVWYYLIKEYFKNQFKDYKSVGAQPAISIPHLKKMLLPLPPLPEQKKIAEILSTWDRAIEKTEKLIDAKTKIKKGLMQQLLTGRMRFEEFGPGLDEEKNHETHKIHENGIPEGWKIFRMHELFEHLKRTDDDVNNPKEVMTISGKYGFLSQNDKFNRVIAGSSLENYIHLKKGEFAYNRGNSKTYPFGCVYKLEIEEGLVPNVYICFKPKAELSEDFYKYYFEHGLLEKQLHRIISSSARGDGLLNVSSHDFFKMFVLYPPLKEQQRSASVLSSIDNEISTLNKKLAAIKQQKKGLMQKLLTGQVRVKV